MFAILSLEVGVMTLPYYGKAVVTQTKKTRILLTEIVLLQFFNFQFSIFNFQFSISFQSQGFVEKPGVKIIKLFSSMLNVVIFTAVIYEWA
jgi:hypothetical protein